MKVPAQDPLLEDALQALREAALAQTQGAEDAEAARERLLALIEQLETSGKYRAEVAALKAALERLPEPSQEPVPMLPFQDFGRLEPGAALPVASEAGGGSGTVARYFPGVHIPG